MDAYDFTNIYLIGMAQMLIGFWCFIHFFKKHVKPFYFWIFALVSLLELCLISPGSIWEILIYTATLFIAGCLILKAHPAQSALYAVITSSVITISYGLWNCVLTAVNPLNINWNQWTEVLFIIIINLLELASVVLICRFIQKYLLYSQAYNNIYTLIMLMPIALIFIIEQYISFNIFGNVEKTAAGNYIFGFDPGQIAIIECCVIGVLFLIMLIYKKLLESLTLISRIDSLKLEGKYLTQYAEQANMMYEKTRSFRHDIENHLTVIQSLINEQRNDEALKYIGEIKTNTAEFSFPVNTGNRILNALLKNKLGYAADLGFKIRCDLTLPYPCGISDTDLCIIISNALDNAIEACKKLTQNTEKFIEITNAVQGDLIVLEIKNSYPQTKIIKEGIGIKNIKAAAKKYNGLVEIFSDKNEFIIKILMVIPQHNNAIS